MRKDQRAKSLTGRANTQAPIAARRRPLRGGSAGWPAGPQGEAGPPLGRLVLSETRHTVPTGLSNLIRTIPDRRQQRKLGDRLLCGRVLGVAYNPFRKIGILQMKPFACCDMTRCIDFFVSIAPEIERIVTISGEVVDVSYIKGSSGWKAVFAELNIADF